MAKHQQIYNDLYRQIQLGELKAGDRLATEKELCRIYSVSRITAMRAVNDLEKAGLVSRTAGRGTFVNVSAESFIPEFKLIIPDLGRRYYSEMANGFCHFFFDKHAIASVIVAKGYDVQYTTLILNRLAQSNNSGIAVVPSGHPERAAALLNILDSQNTNVVIGSRELPGFQGGQYIVDEKEAASKAVDYLLSLGHERIGYGGAVSGYSSSEIRYRGFVEACERHQLKSNILFRHRDVIAFRQFKDALESGTLPTAFVTADESAALYLLEVLHSLNLMVPDDIAIVALDGGEFAPSMDVPLTAVEFPGRLIGHNMAAHLWEFDTKQHKAEGGHIVCHQAELVVRSSCGAQPAKYRHEFLRDQVNDRFKE